MRNYILIGQVMGAKPVSRKDKTTGLNQVTTEVTVQYLDYDINGELVMDIDVVSYPAKSLEEFKANVTKFVAIPYLYLNTPKGTYLFPDEMMSYHFYDTNPLIQKQESKTKIAS